MRLARLCLIALLSSLSAAAQWGGELHLCLRSEPRTFHPALVEDDASETIRYLTGGVLVRVNRLTQELEPGLAASWEIRNGGRAVAFRLREGVRFSDGTPFTASDVAYTMEVLMDPKLHSPTGDAFRSSAGPVKTIVQGDCGVTVIFPEVVAGAVKLFDQVAILSRTSPLKERAVLGPFRVAEHKAGSSILLARNPEYWKTERGGCLIWMPSGSTSSPTAKLSCCGSAAGRCT
jgi:peptide/nickel transport system substrate-binding protein